MCVGILICVCAFTVFPSESSWGAIYSLVGLILIVTGVFRELQFSSLLKRGLVSAGVFVVLLAIFFVADYNGVTQIRW